MVKLIAPCMSGEARGKFGNILVYKKRLSTNVASRYFKPRNPKSALQIIARNRITKALGRWQDATQETKALWRTYAKQFRTTGYNAYMSAFVIYMRDHAEAHPDTPFLP